MNRVSVIVPNFNHAKYLEQRLQSVFEQSFDQFEVLLMDDASTDNSMEILSKYEKHPRARLIVNAENSGSPFKQWNKGIEHTSGEYIWIAETDDYADERFLDVMVQALEDNPEAGLAYCQSILVSDGQSLENPFIAESNNDMFKDHVRWVKGFSSSGQLELANYLVFRNTIPNASAVLIRRSALQAHGIKAPEDMKLAGDWMFWARLLTYSDIVFVPRPFNYFRDVHSGSQRGKQSHTAMELRESLLIYDYIQNAIPISVEIKKKALKHYVKTWAIHAYTRGLSKQNNQSIYEEILRIHPQARSSKLASIWLVYWINYLSAPLRNSPSINRFFRRLRKLSRGQAPKIGIGAS